MPDVGYGSSSTATVHVTVQDVNEGPVFYPDPMVVTKEENISVGSFVAMLNATDPDYLQSQSIRSVSRVRHVTITTAEQTNLRLHTHAPCKTFRWVWNVVVSVFLIYTLWDHERLYH